MKNQILILLTLAAVAACQPIAPIDLNNPLPADEASKSAPVVKAGDDFSVEDSDGDGKEIVQLKGSANDIENNIFSYTLSKGGVVIVASTSPSTLTQSFTLNVGIHHFIMQAIDGQGLVGTDDVWITVDPKKEVVVVPPPPTPVPGDDSWIECAPENGTCQVPAMANVRYGQNSTWFTKNSISSSISCSNETFGDPLVGVYKKCEYQLMTVTSSGLDIVAEGDSLSTLTETNYTGLFEAANSSLKIKVMAENGSTLADLNTRKQALIDLRPKVVSVLIGANDLGQASSGEAYALELFAYVKSLRSQGIKVAVGTVLPRHNNPGAHNDKRLVLNRKIRNAVGIEIDVVLDFANHPMIGDDPDSYYNYIGDGMHPKPLGQSRMAEIYSPIMKSLVNPQAPKPEGTLVLGQVPSIPSNFTVSDWLFDGIGVADSGAPDVVGAFRFICNPSHNKYDDPIVYPGQPGKSHLHTFFGNTETNAFSTYESLRSSGNGTCQGGPLNRSAYWIPAMMNGRGKVVMPDHLVIYYKAVPGTTRLPRGLRMIFGNNPAKPTDNQTSGHISWHCEDGSSRGNTINSVSCPAGKRIYAELNTQPCWDGKNLDSPDHRSHMAYRLPYNDNGQSLCPSTHPVELPVFSLKPMYTTEGNEDHSQWFLASDHTHGHDGVATKLPPGSTMHSDWFGAWDDNIMKLWGDHCIDKLLSCSASNFGNGSMGVTPPTFSWSVPERLVNPPVRPAH